MMYLAMTTPAYPDMIARMQTPVLQMPALVLGAPPRPAQPLTKQELQIVREAMWKREANRAQRWPNILHVPTPHQQMTIHYLQNGGIPHAGHFPVVNGLLASALQPNTFALAEKWQEMKKLTPLPEEYPSWLAY